MLHFAIRKPVHDNFNSLQSLDNLIQITLVVTLIWYEISDNNLKLSLRQHYYLLLLYQQ